MPTASPSPPPRHRQPLILISTRRLQSGPEKLDEQAVDELLEQAQVRGWRLLHLNKTGGSLSGENQPAGALVTLLPGDPDLQPLLQTGCPIIRLARLPHPHDADLPAVIPDYAMAAHWALNYYRQRGFTRLGLVGHENLLAIPVLRDTLHNLADQARLKLRSYLFQDQPPHRHIQESNAERFDRRAHELTDWINSQPKPIGLIAASPGNAMMIEIACERSGLSVPEQVAILSIGDDRVDCAMCSVPISAIDLNPADLARTAVELLNASIHHKQTPPPRTLVPPRGIVARRSSDILAVSDPTVARAIRYMWDRLDQPLSVDDVARAMRTPRYRLERQFKKHLERGVYAELRRARLEHFARLLRSTDQTVDQLAPQVGYQSAKRLHRVFQETFNTTPRRYRLSHSSQDKAEQHTWDRALEADAATWIR